MTAVTIPAELAAELMRRPVLRRNIERAAAARGACVLWDGRINARGYGHAIGLDGKNWMAHRLVYALLVGDIPTDRPSIDHRCFNPACINPRHLQALTFAENQARARPANREHCIRGHERVFRSGRRRCLTCEARWRKQEPTGRRRIELTPELVIRARDMYRAGAEHKEIRAALNLTVSRSALHAALIGNSWKQVPGAVTHRRREPRRDAA